MNLSMRGELATAFKSGSQRAGNVTEAWGADNFYCPNCSSPKLNWLKPGTKASDYQCPRCGFWFQLKSKQSPIGSTITDGAYGAMMEAIRNDALPSFYFLHYEITGRAALPRSQAEQQLGPTNEIWMVRNLLLVPHFAFPPSAIVKRPPLSAKAYRAGWVGCVFDLRRIPADARIQIISTRSSEREFAHSNNQSRLTSAATIITPPAEVREQFKRVKPLKDISVKERGWTLDVLNGVRNLGKKEFTNDDAYTLTASLEKLHPDNRHVRDKIRQQLQVLRDTGLLLHIGTGCWRLV